VAAFGGPVFASLLGIGLVGVVFLFAVVLLFSHFLPFLFFFGWMVPFFLIPALRFSARGMAGRREGWYSPLSDVSEACKEKELLGALARYGEITPARAALETSLSVSEADRMLSELTKNGHIEVHAREGGLVYALWEHDRRELPG
jgi:hypothetical protein